MLNDLKALLSMLRLNGVKTYDGPLNDDGDSVQLELLGYTPDTSKAGPAEPDSSLCNCHHPHFMHMNGLCAMACTIDVCAGPEEKK